MAVREYKGARYVPIFADPPQWDKTKTYEALTVVILEGASYVSRQPVPAGIDIKNTDYWILAFNFSSQMESIRKLAQAGYDNSLKNKAEIDPDTTTTFKQGAYTDIADGIFPNDDKLATSGQVYDAINAPEPPNPVQASESVMDTKIEVGKFAYYRGTKVKDFYNTTIYTTPAPIISSSYGSCFQGTEGFAIATPFPTIDTSFVAYSCTSGDAIMMRSVYVNTAGTRGNMRAWSPIERAGATPATKITIQGMRKQPPATIAAASPHGAAIATAANSYASAALAAKAEGKQLFDYGANWTFESSNVMTNAAGSCMMECDTLVFLAVSGTNYNNSPLAAAAYKPNQTYDFNDYKPVYDTLQKTNEFLNKPLTITSTQCWYWWDTQSTFSNIESVLTGDIVVFRSIESENTLKWFDAVTHEGIMVRENGSLYIISMSTLERTDGLGVQKILFSDYLKRAEENGWSTDYYFARVV